MTDLTITITDHRVRRRTWHESSEAVYTGDEVKFALGAILDGIEARKPDAVLCQALYEHPELCELAASIHELRKISDLDDIEAHPLLTAIRQHGNPEWLQAMAGNELARRGVNA